ncbi:TrkH family potassium uptake protein [Marinicella litoralis]|uniref:Trk system potassium uptake protein n=1 Tax=Marinicella litoralis TaxID=644220 RepID=A0A4R6XLP7_9GAMM|nr:TrkH family potassium uptake protein [Marinicella litoralis]TDR20555.1 trk system potassium uptake protein TrkH [Marinicella litoralis]
MNPRLIAKIIGLLLLVASSMMLPPALVGYIYQDGDVWPFIEGFGTLALIGAVPFFMYRNIHAELKIRSGFLVVGASWLIVGLAGALPLYLSDYMNLSVTDAIFESISGLTTTGATILTNIDELPHSIKYYRQQLQWFGGMGIIVLAVAVLPMLRIGGMQIFRAETPGPMKDQKLTPRITETAKALWYIYLGITVMCTLSYYMAGMNMFDAICHAFSTISIGGFSTYNASMGHFNNSLIEMIAVIFMIIAGINFASHFLAWKSASIRTYLLDTEVKVFIGFLALASLATSFQLYLTDTSGSLYESLRQGTFQAVSIGSTAGFTTESFHLWPGALPLLLILFSTIGGCAGSTGGGFKVIRMILLFKMSMRELYRLIHPHGKYLVKINGKTVNYRVLDSVSAFFVQFLFLLCVFGIILAGLGENLTTAFSASLACLTNLGPALGDAGSNYASLSDGSKSILTIAMIFGRLELFTLFILLIPAYWEF